MSMAETILEALDAAGLGMTITVDRDGTLDRVYANETLAGLLGYSIDEIDQVPPMIQFPDDERDRANEMLRAWRAGEPIPKFYRTAILTPRGERIPVDVSLSTTMWNGCKATVAFVRDVRDALRASQRLEESEKRFRAVVELAPDAVVVAVDGKIRYANRAAAQVFRFATSSELVGRELMSFVEPTEKAIASTRIGSVVRGSRLLPREYIAVRADGTSFPFEIASMSIDWEGEPAILGIGRDLTERRRTDAELIQADRMASVGLLAAGVAHEINNPLTYMLLHLTKLRRMLPGLLPDDGVRAEVDRLLAQALEGGDRVGGIVRDLLSFVRGHDSGHGTCDVTQVAESALKLAHTALDSRARVVRKLEATPPVQADEARLGQVFVNLIANALQAMRDIPEARRELEVCVGMDDGRVRADICDRGPGIDPAIAEHIFDPFFTTKDVGEGTGLGLAISKSIITGAGGVLQVFPRDGGGTRLSMWLPVAERKHTVPRRTTPIPEVRGRVLLIDDDAQVANAIADLLSERYEVECSDNCREGLRLLLEHPFDAILCELTLTGGGGVAEIERALDDRPGLFGRILFMSGGARTEAQRRFAAAHAERVLSKPLDVEVLFERLDALIGPALDAGR